MFLTVIKKNDKIQFIIVKIRKWKNYAKRDNGLIYK
jgi:hypothetical protein